MSADPHEVLEDLDDSDDDECIYIDSPDPAYLWSTDDEDMYIILEQSRGGTWLPRGRPISTARAEQYLEADSYEVRPQTKLPPGRHPKDRGDSTD